MDNDTIDWLLGELDAIPSVEIKRLGTQDAGHDASAHYSELCRILERHHPVYVNTQFNHPLEVTGRRQRPARCWQGAGVPLGNQAISWQGINDSPHVMKNSTRNC